MNISVPIEFVPFVDELVSGGVYSTADDVVRDALSQMRDRRARFEALKATLAEAREEIDRGEGVPFDVEGLIAEARQSYSQRQRV
jgi:antitoxin ParD1/3/4